MQEHRVLVVDDDELIRRLLVEYFREHSTLAVDWARDGAEALHFLSSRAYACLVLDLMMPHMSGIDLLTSLRALLADPFSKLQRPPAVFVITGAPAEDVPSEKLAEMFPGLVRQVFRKPLDVDALTRAVSAAIGG
ncbi:MAG TPA: response regulator [Thermoanaerobaculia bacterium]|nr:response regulator [Thermoanaerobaculia bacterium]